MTDDASLRGDCSRCIGLCCVALAFDRGPHFAFDKPASTACLHLDARHSCAIHDRLEHEGFSGCARYDCRGAGQLVTAMFAGLSWRDSPAVARQMFMAFAKLRAIQLMRSIAPERTPVAGALNPSDGWTLTAVLTVDIAALRRTLADQMLAIGPSGAMDRNRRGNFGRR